MTDLITTDVLPEAKFKIFTGLLKAYEGEDGLQRLSGVASSTTRDHHGDVMLESALRDMEAAANNNMTIFLNHSYNVPEDVAGSVTKAFVVQRGYDGDGNPNWDLDMDISINRENERAVKAWNAIKAGTKLGLSIGAMIPNGGAIRDKDTGALTISRLNLLETSIVSIPANPRSWISNAVKAITLAEEDETKSHGVVINVTPALYTSNSTNDSITLSADLGETVTESTTEIEVEVDEASLDTSASQEAVSEPGNEGEAVTGTVLEAAELDLDPVVRQSVGSMLQMLEATTARLVEARELLDAEKAARKAAEDQRDQVAEMANALFVRANAIFDRLADTPMGRKTSFSTQKDAFSDLEGIYSEPFRRLLNKGD